MRFEIDDLGNCVRVKQGTRDCHFHDGPAVETMAAAAMRQLLADIEIRDKVIAVLSKDVKTEEEKKLEFQDRAEEAEEKCGELNIELARLKESTKTTELLLSIMEHEQQKERKAIINLLLKIYQDGGGYLNQIGIVKACSRAANLIYIERQSRS